MRIGSVVALLIIAVSAGYYFGERRDLAASVVRVDTTPRADARNLARGRERVNSDARDTSFRQLPPRDPRGELEDEVEAMRRGDVSAVAQSIVLTTEAKTLIESAALTAPPELTREYPTPELLAAFVFCGAQRIEGFRIESTTIEQPDGATQLIAYKFASESEWRTEKIAFRRLPDGWRRVVNDAMAKRVAAIIGIRKQ